MVSSWHRSLQHVLWLLALSLLTASAALLELSNDGPVVVGAPITFKASYSGRYAYESLIYEFQDVHDSSMFKQVITAGTATATFTYDKVPDVTEQVMHVTVWQQWIGSKLWVMDERDSKFNLTSYLVGDLLISQPSTPEESLDHSIVSSGAPVDVNCSLHDPSDFFASFSKSYEWLVNDVVVNGTESVLKHIFPPATEAYNVTCSVLVISEQKKMDRHGNLTRSLISKEPISKLEVTGKFFISRNQTLDLSITCASGSPPFFFCKEIDYIDDNCTTLQLLPSDECAFHIDWYFRTAGKHNVSLRVTNDVSSAFERIEISVLDFEITPSITFVVVPVVCSVLAVFIIVFGIALHVQQRRRGFTVEVADFDFSARDDSDLLVKTFFQRLRESLVSSVRRSFLFRHHGHDMATESSASAFMGIQRNRHSSLDSDPAAGDRDDGYASRSLTT